MTADITIPPEALEAAMRAYPKLTRDEAMWIVGCALKAWPGMWIDARTFVNQTRDGTEQRIILPLTENENG